MLEVKNSTGDVIETWTDSPAKRVVDEQVAYMVTNILGDRTARYDNGVGFVVPDVWTATKTGTTTTQNAAVVKDSLIESFSTAISTFVWNGNHDGSGFSAPMGEPVRYAVGTYMERVHKEVYEPEGKWHYGDQPVQPAGIQTLTVNGRTDIWPSWFNKDKNSGITKETLTFNKYNHLLASTCTSEAYKIQVEVTKITDPVTGKDTYDVPEPYNREVEDTCNYLPPQVSVTTSGSRIITIINKGSEPIANKDKILFIDGRAISGVSFGSDGVVSGYTLNGSESSIKVMVTDASGYTAVSEITRTPTNSDSNGDSSSSNNESNNSSANN